MSTSSARRWPRPGPRTVLSVVIAFTVFFTARVLPSADAGPGLAGPGLAGPGLAGSGLAGSHIAPDVLPAWINLGESISLPDQPRARPLALTSGDFDGDG